MTKPHMTLSNGDIIHDGEFGITRDGLKVGPMTCDYLWRSSEYIGAWSNKGCSVPSEFADIVAKWHPAKPAKRDLRTIDEPFGELDERTQKRLRKAAKPGWPVEWFNGVDWASCVPVFGALKRYRLDPTFTPPAKRRVIYVINGMTFETARAAKTAYTGCEPVKFKECKN